MKTLKVILFILLALVVIVFIVSLFLPSKYKFEATQTIKAPVEQIYDLVFDYKNWPQWDPWNEADSNMKNEFSGEPGVGHKRSFESKTQGNGSMEIVEFEVNKFIKSKLIFQNSKKPAWDNWSFESTGEGVLVNWSVDLETGFNPVSKIMIVFYKGSMERHITKGLENLKTLAEFVKTEEKTTEVLIQNYPPQKYIGIKKTIGFDPKEIQSFMAEAYAKLMKYLQENQIPQFGPPAAFYFTYDEEKKIMEAMPAIPVAPHVDNKLPKEMEYYQTSEGQSAVVLHVGSYEKIGTAWLALEEYMKSNNLESNGAPFEVYMTDPMVEKDTAKWQTQVVFPFKSK